MPVSFGSKLQKCFDTFGQICIGVDPHSSILNSWGLGDDSRGLESFSKKVIEASVDRVGIIKPQVAFFEKHGSQGFKVLEDISTFAKDAGLLVLMDAKRGDIGSTMQGYFEAWLGKSAPFAADALTISPYLGFDSLSETLSQAHELGKGVFVLAATSNPEAAALQASALNGITIAAKVWTELEKINQVTSGSKNILGDFGAVIGATVNFRKLGIQEVLSPNQTSRTPILAPGFGAQGALLREARDIFADASSQVLFSVSRSVLEAGPLGLANSIDGAKKELMLGLG